MSRIDFSKIKVYDLEGNEHVWDIHRDISNLLYMHGVNIEERELGRKIYNCRDTDGNPAEVELSPEEVLIVMRFIGNFSYAVQEQVVSILQPQAVK